jgi:hypothetical protein
MKRSRLSRSVKSGAKTRLTDTAKIEKMIAGAQHIGTSFIEGGAYLETKTFNLYALRNGYIVTNHYGLDLINATRYPDMGAVKKDFGDVKWVQYHLPLLPR